MGPAEIAKTTIKAAQERKAGDIRVLYVNALTTLADYYIICTANSGPQLRAVSDAVEERLSEAGVEPLHIEGQRSGSWRLIDYGSVVVHMLRPEAREFYALERLWSDARSIDIDEFLTKGGDEEK